MRLRLRELHVRDALMIGIPALALLGAGFWVAAQFIKPAPPSRLVISTGGDGGAYQRFAAFYKPIVERNGIAFIERPSAGAVENLERLRDPKEEVDFAFVQGGLGVGTDAEGLVSLGSIYYELLWIFYRSPVALDRLRELAGKRLAVGPEGSGTRKLALDLLEANGATAPPTQILPAGGLAAVEALQQGKVDAIFLVGPADSGAVWAALYTDGLRLMSLVQADAYARRYPFLSKLTLPRGAIDFVRDIPARDVTLLAPIATLVAREGTHPALIDLLLDTASEVHGKAGLFQRAGEFPNPHQVDFPLASEADRFYKSGRPFLQRYLPFWAATLINRMLVMLVPLLAIALPLMRILPVLYGWRVRSRIFKWYGQLKFLERSYTNEPTSRSQADWLAELDQLDTRVNRIRTPLGFANHLYTLREHIALVRQAVLKQTSIEGTAHPGAREGAPTGAA